MALTQDQLLSNYTTNLSPAQQQDAINSGNAVSSSGYSQAVASNQLSPIGGQVLGATTTNYNSGGGPTGSPSDNKPGMFWDAADGWKPVNDAGSQLDAGYNDYINSLNDQLGSLGTQNTNQINAAQSSYDTGIANIGTDYTQGVQSLDTNRQKTLRDLTDNLTQSFKQGNTFLGTRGASDSSAANQYSYALAKEGNRARGDVQSQYDQNLFQLNNIVDKEKRIAKTEFDNQLLQISNWFAEAQQSISTLKGQAAQQKSNELLTIAMNEANRIKQENSSRLSMLDQWAMSNAKSIEQARGMMAQNSQFSMQAPSQFGSINGGGQQSGGMFGYGQSNEDKRKGIFG